MQRPAPDDGTPVYVISAVAHLLDLHAQTLRQYDRLGLVSPGRAPGGSRRYSALDVSRLRRILELTREGINLEGVRRILALEDQVSELQERLHEAAGLGEGAQFRRARGEAERLDEDSRYLPVPFGVQGSTALVLWRRG